MIIFQSLLTTFKLGNIFWGVGTVMKIGLILKSSRKIKLRLSKSLNHKVELNLKNTKNNLKNDKKKIKKLFA